MLRGKKSIASAKPLGKFIVTTVFRKLQFVLVG